MMKRSFVRCVTDTIVSNGKSIFNMIIFMLIAMHLVTCHIHVT